MIKSPAFFCGATGKSAAGANRKSSRIFDIPVLTRFKFFIKAITPFLVCAVVSCATEPVTEETPLPTEFNVTQGQQRASGQGGVADEIRLFTEEGVPSSLLKALEIINSRELAGTEFGRAMIAVNVALMNKVYPSIQARLPVPDPPVTHSYSKILREAERGVYISPLQNSTDYFEYVLPFLSIYIAAGAVSGEIYDQAVADLEKAVLLNPSAALSHFFLGIVYERRGMYDEAFSRFSYAWENFPDCYPAAQGIARIMEARGSGEEALSFLQELVVNNPDNIQVKRQLALAYYRSGDWSRAGTAVAEILQKDSRDGEFVLMRAHILIEEGQFLQAQAPLDIYATINPNNRLYLFLRARVQYEGYHNRDAALNYLRSIIRSPQAESEQSEFWSNAAVYTARLLMESVRPEDQAEGRELLEKLLESAEPSLEVVSLALEDAIRREAWAGARIHLARLLEERRTPGDLLAAYSVEKAQGNNAAALSYAREFYDLDPSNEDGIIAYISALIDTGRIQEASGMIERRLNALGGGVVKSNYFYLRSRIRTNEELIMNDLRSCLFEDPRNLNALIAMFEIYHRRRDERRAVYYLKQALALAPNNPRLKRYEAEYAAALGSTY